MEVQIPKKPLNCLQCMKTEVQTLEETQELRIPEQMPDVGRILCTWGQVLLRSKEWRDSIIAVSGGVMAWVLYMPEGESKQLQTAQAWIPFQLKWNLPETKYDGTIQVFPLLQSVDARTTSARKIVVRATVSVLGQAYVQDTKEACLPEELPESVYMMKNTYPLLIPREAGEKFFELDEELTLPGSAPKVKEIVRFSLAPELIDMKVLSGKVAFRGTALLHLLYFDEADELNTWDFEIPFSQYAQLETDYEQEAQCRVIMALTALELDTEPDGKLRLKAGVTGQYMIYDTTFVTVGADAYSPDRQVTVQLEQLEVPTVLGRKQKTVSAELVLHQGASKILDSAFYPAQPVCRKNAETLEMELFGAYHVLYLDEQAQLQGTSARWNGKWDLQTSPDAFVEAAVCTGGLPQVSNPSGQINLRSDIYIDSTACLESSIPMISSMEIGQPEPLDPDRPNLILQRKGKQSLWELAKKHGTTVDRIMQANALNAEPEDDRLLLIPVL